MAPVELELEAAEPSMTPEQSPPHSLSRRERIAWLRLARSEGVGPITFNLMLERFGTAEAALEHLPAHARNAGKKAIRICTRAAAERELETVERCGGRIIAMTESDFPPLLREVANAPPLITVFGNPHILSRPSVAIVGARNASINGRNHARRIAHDLADAGKLVVSGLARGIDAAAHEGSVDGGTAAVVAGGADIIYPPDNEALYHRIVDQGAVIAEMPVGFKPQGRHFPRRNRIIAGMSVGVVVVEAALRSGSLITAGLANDMGREVFAIPGSPLDPRCEGPNMLIRDGAQLVRNAADILDALNAMTPKIVSEPPSAMLPPEIPGSVAGSVDPANLEQVRRAVMSLLSPTPTPVDELIRHCQFSAAEVRTVLSELEVAGRLDYQVGARVALLMEQDTS